MAEAVAERRAARVVGAILNEVDRGLGDGGGGAARGRRLEDVDALLRAGDLEARVAT